ncbi:MAG: glycosyltransferase, partial [Actinobacteria bacterium]|nr:glycosyltransferase [Actinomycetota bacterium]
MSDVEVFGWLADHTGCGQIRIKQPLSALRSETGLKTEFSEKLITTDLENLPPTLIGQRVCKDGPSQLWFTVCAMKNRPRTVYELDDDLWNIDPSNVGAFKWFINYMPRWMLDWERPQRDELTIGWGGSGTHGMDWAHSGPHINRYLKRSKMPFRLIGGGLDQARDQLGIPVEQVSALGWFKGVDDYWRSIDYDIGVIPLRPHLFNQSKSHIKYLENSALGIPTVAADTGPYSRVIKHGETGFLVKRDHEWAKYLQILVEDEDARN